MALTRMVGALLFRGDCVLLGFRCPGRATYGGVWDMVGGHVADGESCAAALRRELDEELGIGLLSVPVVWRREIDQALGIELSIYRIDTWRGTISNAAVEEHAELRWFTIGELGGLVFPHPSYPSMLAASFVDG